MAQNYLAEILEALQAGRIKPGTLIIVSLTHEEGCTVFETGKCNCAPSVVTPDSKLRKTEKKD